MIKRHSNLSFAEHKPEIHIPYIVDCDFNPSHSKLVFIHPPKTAGTNISFWATAMSGIRDDFASCRFGVPRVDMQSPNLVYAGWTGGLERARQDLVENRNAVQNYNFISGHFPYGFHYLVDLPASYIALVRNPVEREISSANFDYQRGYVSGNDVYDYIRTTMIDNPQTRMIAGESAMSGECNLETLNQAKENIRKNFLFVAPHTEAFEVLKALSGIYESPILSMGKNQVTGIKLIDESDEQLNDFLKQKHLFDLLLLDFVETQWNKWKVRHIKGNRPFNNQDEILYFPPNFAATKIPEFLNYQDMVDKMEGISASLQEVSQSHTELESLPNQNKGGVNPTNFPEP